MNEAHDEPTVEQQIRALVEGHREVLHQRVAERRADLINDARDHYLIYRALGLPDEQADSVEEHQNIGRFLWNRAGAVMQEAVAICFRTRFPDATSDKVDYEDGGQTRTYEIDLLVGTDAYEIKWRDATTDGNHVEKEHKRIRCVQEKGYRPIGLTFFLPTRTQARRIQDRLARVYADVGGVHLVQQAAWDHVQERTGTDLRAIIERIAEEVMTEAGQ